MFSNITVSLVNLCTSHQKITWMQFKEFYTTFKVTLQNGLMFSKNDHLVEAFIDAK